MARLTRSTCLLFVLLGAFTSLGDEPRKDQVTRQDTAPSALDKISPYVIEQLQQQETAEVVIYLENPDTGEVLAEEEIQRILTEIDSDEITLDYLPDAIVSTLSDSEIKALARRPEIKYIVPFMRMVPQLYDSVVIIGAEPTWEIQVEGVSLTGSGRSICVIDTGVDWTHPDLTSKNIAGGNFDCFTPPNMDCPLDVDTTDTSGHGTHVSGIAAADGGISGIAKGADLVSVKVFPDGGNPTTNNVAVRWGINKCMDLVDEYDITAITISIGFPGLPSETNCDSQDQAMTDAINNAFDNNIPVTIATGNASSSTEIMFPSCITKAIPVSATNKDDTLAEYTNYNSLVQLFAPGTTITSTCIEEEGTYCIKDGTSMSTPMVAGAIAIIQQFLDLTDQTMTPLEIEEHLFNYSDPILDLPFENYRRINIFNAVTSCFADAGCEDGNACTTDICNTDTGECMTGPPVDCSDDNICNGIETCDPDFGCQGGEPLSCDNGLFCDGAESCDPSSGCQPGTPPEVDDGVSCTEDSCDKENDVIVHTPSDELCDNELWCDGAETCDVELDCQPGSPPVQDDGVACTIDSCDEENDVIVHTPNDEFCNNESFCDGLETCDPIDDCQPGDPVHCEDGEQCDEEVDECVPTCPADFDDNGFVDAFDLAQLLGAWGANEGHPADFDGNGFVDAFDLAQLLGSWGPCKP